MDPCLVLIEDELASLVQQLNKFKGKILWLEVSKAFSCLKFFEFFPSIKALFPIPQSLLLH